MSNIVPKVAVVTRTKDRPLLLRRCIESVLGQVFGDWIHVIVNDGGDQNAFNALLSEYKDDYKGRLKVIHNDVSQGMQNASNIAIQNSESEFITIHDDDDSWDPEFLRACVEHLESDTGKVRYGVATQVVWVFERLDSNGFVTEISRQNYFPFKEVSLFDMAGRNRFPPIAFVYRRSVHDEIGLFKQEFNEVGDWDFHLRFLLKHDIDVIDRKLALYHWRHEVEDDNYGNTVTTGLQAHLGNDLKLRNHYLREDLDSNQMGLGFLINMSRQLRSEAGGDAANVQSLSPELRGMLDRLVNSSEHLERITSDLDRLWKIKCVIMQILLYTRRRIGTLASTSTAGGSADGARQDRSMMRKLKSADILSVDVFDTALARTVFRPIDVFLYIQPDIRRIAAVEDLDFVNLRREAEAGVRDDNYRETGVEDVDLGMIYDRFCSIAGVDPELRKSMMDVEMEAERRFCYPNPHIQKLCAEGRRQGKKVVFTSDMYLPRDFVLELLRKNGYEADELLISSSAGKTKHTGGLFDVFCREYNCDPARVLHVGDNHQSDSVQASAKGMIDFHYNSAAYGSAFVDQSSFLHRGDCTSTDSIFAGLAKRSKLEGDLSDDADSELFRSIGYEVIGPLYLSFVAWVIGRAMQNGVKKLFFLARDGYHLKKVFERIKTRYGLEIEAEYMFSSRRLINFPRISRLDKDSMAFLMTPNPGMRVKHFLQRIGIDPAEHPEELRRAGFASPEQRITTPSARYIDEATRLRMGGLLRSLEWKILEMAERERQTLFNYFDDIEFRPNHIAVVDVGWQASSVKSLQELLRMRGQHCRLQGYYFGTWHFAQASIDAGARLESFFMHLDRPAGRSKLMAESVELLESFFWAPHATIAAISKEGGEWSARYGERELTGKMNSLMEMAVEHGLRFVDDALDIIPDFDSIERPYAYLEEVLSRVFRHPTLQEAVTLGQIAHRTGFGGYGPVRHIAQLPSMRDMLTKFNVLQTAYEHSFWKTGFLRQLHPAEAVRLTR